MGGTSQRSDDAMTPPLRVVVRNDGDHTVVAVPGRIFIDTVDPLRAALTPLLDTDRPRVIVDMAGVEICDSSGLNLIAAATTPRPPEAAGSGWPAGSPACWPLSLNRSLPPPEANSGSTGIRPPAMAVVVSVALTLGSAVTALLRAVRVWVVRSHPGARFASLVGGRESMPKVLWPCDPVR
jgi:hypothetical protein